MSQITIIKAKKADKDILKRLLQLYLHDFSEFATKDDPYGKLSKNGEFEYPYLDRYWEETGRIPLFIHYGEDIAGFALINKVSIQDRPLDYSMAEFFILRKYRRGNVGSEAVQKILSTYSGQWEIPVTSYNIPAQNFWKKALRGVGGFEEEKISNDHWDGPVFRISIS